MWTLEAFQRVITNVDLKNPGRIHSQKMMAEEWTSTSPSSWVWSLTSFTCGWDPFDALALAAGMWVAVDCWNFPRHVSELRERLIWRQNIWVSVGHALVCDVVYYKLNSGTTHVQAFWCIMRCLWCKKDLQLSDQLFRFFSPASL